MEKRNMVSQFVLHLAALAFAVLAASAVIASDLEWPKVLSAANKEGKLVIYSQAGPGFREGLVEPFKRKFPNIDIEYTGTTGSRIPPKILTERRAGMYLVDLVISGPTSIFTGLKPADALERINPFLGGPDIRDQSAWFGGRMQFVDNERSYLLIQHLYVHTPFVYNPDLVSSSEIRSLWDLVKPMWKGKLIMLDPIIPGAGIGAIGNWIQSKDLGEEFIRQLFTKQDVAFSRDHRQVLDSVVRGRYAVALAFRPALATRMIEDGLNLRIMDPHSLKESPATTVGSAGGVAVINRPPNPYAVRVYLNYLLSREGQYELSKAMQVPSARVDVPTDHLPKTFYPLKPGVDYVDSHTEESIKSRLKARDLVKSILRK